MRKTLFLNKNIIAKQIIITNFAAQMHSDDMLIVDLHEIKSKEKTLNFVLENDFFSNNNSLEIKGGEVNVMVNIAQTASEKYRLSIEAQGFVVVLCDRCCKDMQQNIKLKTEIPVQLGDKNEDDGDVITVERNNGSIDLSWTLFEQIALSLPLNHTHKQGMCDKEMEKAIKTHSNNKETTKEDPRWDALKNININN